MQLWFYEFWVMVKMSFLVIKMSENPLRHGGDAVPGQRKVTGWAFCLYGQAWAIALGPGRWRNNTGATSQRSQLTSRVCCTDVRVRVF